MIEQELIEEVWIESKSIIVSKVIYFGRGNGRKKIACEGVKLEIS